MFVLHLRTHPSLPRVRLELWRAHAIVLFDWLMSVNRDSVPINYPAEKQALADLTAPRPPFMHPRLAGGQLCLTPTPPPEDVCEVGGGEGGVR